MKKLSSDKETLFVVCPGRGSYLKETLGYLQKYHQNSYMQKIISECDKKRISLNQISLESLDSQKIFNPVLHTLGENASALIYLCAYGDFFQLLEKKYNIVAITGNSMGHYISCVCSESIDPMKGFDLVNTMGSMMTNGLIGGQVIDSLVDDQWMRSNEKVDKSEKLLQTIDGLYISIELGGYRVYGGEDQALKKYMMMASVNSPYPFKLMNHGAFHTPLMSDISFKAQEIFKEDFFDIPQYPFIDGNGQIYSHWTAEPSKIREYTLVDQVLNTYDFTKAISVGLKEFAPSRIVLLGPGNTLGGAIGQILISLGWNGIENKNDFIKIQKEDPFLLSMGMMEQRGMLV